MSIFAVSDGEKRGGRSKMDAKMGAARDVSQDIRGDLVIGRLGRNPSDVCSGDYSIGESLAQFSGLASCV